MRLRNHQDVRVVICMMRSDRAFKCSLHSMAEQEYHTTIFRNADYAGYEGLTHLVEYRTTILLVQRSKNLIAFALCNLGSPGSGWAYHRRILKWRKAVRRAPRKL